jgi:ATP/maltotriose-dependent transcriptional regulator MalT
MAGGEPGHRRQIADRTQEILCLGHLGWLAVQECRAPEAAERLSAALALAEGIDSRAEQSWLQAGLAETYCLIGDLDQALTYAQCARALAEASGRVHDQALAARVLARVKQMPR